METWIFITVLTAAAVTEIFLSVNSLKKYAVIIPVTKNIRVTYELLEKIYNKMIHNNKYSLMIMYIDGASADTLEICRRFSADYSRAVIYHAEL